ncbi:multiple inositol polyphosphate phosphatase 1-like [Maniola jurtina]|uniref:multiple inositol polyphosphate phosphatase 1-like n=1 Tax=Maniola jurtina TaxID=191418 RepID=UPI001E68D436|nr:multiple inositol polyphosphate phosphatase 1-like [Maniola jurtina]
MGVKQALFLLLGLFSIVVCSKNFPCYWNDKCMYDMFGTATPYDSVRGDLRDQVEDDGCEVLSIWSLHRHGNRNPGADVTRNISALQAKIKHLLHDPTVHLRHHNNCAQDTDDLMNWRWNSTLDSSASYLTGTGYEELYDLGRRIEIQYQNFLKSVEKVHFRATNQQRTVTSLKAFVHGMTAGTPSLANLSMGIHPPLDRDDVLRPYENCQRYQDEVLHGQLLTDELAAYDTSPEFLAIRDELQSKLPVDYQLTHTEVFTLYELCRFDRSWSEKLRSPWCSFFSIRHLLVLEYRDDVRHYYRNGYGSWVNSYLGALPLKDLYENFVNAIEGKKTLVSYFTHDTMLDMVFCALGLYKDPKPLQGSAGIKWIKKEENDDSQDTDPMSRMWRTSEFAPFASNFIAVLSRCDESGKQTHRVRLFINEKPTPLCPEEGCTWQQFLDIFQVFSEADLDFCAKEWAESGAGTAAFLTGRSNTKIGMATILFVLIITVLSVL